MYTLKEFEFDLPDELIARFPAATRTASRLLHANIEADIRQHLQFSAIHDLLAPGDLLVFNDTKVLKARLRGQKKSGGKIECLIERILSPLEALVQVKVSKPPKIGDALYFQKHIVFLVEGIEGRFYHVKLMNTSYTILEALELIGEMPIPPYFAREATSLDETRYQTVYAKHQGSVASPTAGLHFDEGLIDRLRAKGVQTAFLTLHIGAGTFLPVRVEKIAEHRMHQEYLDVSHELVDKVRATRAAGGRVIAVGTTSVRALETASQTGELRPYKGETTIFIYPGYQFRVVDALITNFHLPGSSLIMLVAAFAGLDLTMSLYQDAIREQYRFFSYGDAMFIEKN